MTSAFGGQHSIQLSYGCPAACIGQTPWGRNRGKLDGAAGGPYHAADFVGHPVLESGAGQGDAVRPVGGRLRHQRGAGRRPRPPARPAPRCHPETAEAAPASASAAVGLSLLAAQENGDRSARDGAARAGTLS